MAKNRSKAQRDADILRQAKECKVCHEDKPFDKYAKKSRYNDGRDTVCKECQSKARYPNASHKRAKRDADIRRQAKVCVGCKEDKPFSEYRKQADKIDGKTSKCRECLAEEYIENTKHVQEKRFRTKKQIALDIEKGSKKCAVCKEDKPFTEFKKHPRFRDGHSSDCKSCHQKYAITKRASYRNSMLKSNYGITENDYQEMLKEQGGVCAICKGTQKVVSRLGKVKALHVDHCHTTGKIRGILCGRCNTGLGMFCDSLDNLQAAFAYLVKHIPEQVLDGEDKC